jgi:hypothetical protein
MNEASVPPPPRTDPLAAALAFAIREAVRLETERATLIEVPAGANVSTVNAETEQTSTPEANAA